MKRLYIISIACFFLSNSTFSQNKELVILHTNDLHSHLQGDAPEADYTPNSINDDTTNGGFARIATVIKDEKNGHPATLVVDAGDFLMGTLFQAIEMNTGFELHLMKEMGYDAVAIGNHEFDFGVEAFSNYINLANKREIPQLLLSNIKFNPKDKRDDSFKELYDKGLIKNYEIIEKNGIKIGIFSLLGEEAYDVANAQPLEIENPTKSAKKIVNILRKEENVDVVIALSHSGVWFDKDNTIKMIEDAKVAQKVDGIDVIVSGHTHSLIDRPIVINNTIIVQAGEYGKQIGKITLSITPEETKLSDYQLITIDDKIQGDAKMQQAINQQKQQLNRQILTPLNYHYDDDSFRLNYKLNYDLTDVNKCNIGNFIADAINYSVNQVVPDYNNIAVIGHGMIRGSLDSGIVHLPEVFKVASLGLGNDNIPGYPLARVYLTAKEIKCLMGLLIKTSEKSTNYFMFTSGLKVNYLCKNNSYKKIESIEIADKEGIFHTIDCSKKNEQLYSIVADSYMISFLGKIKKMSFGLINIAPKNKNGIRIKNMSTTLIDNNPQISGIQEEKVWLSILKYAQSFEKGKDGLPSISNEYINAKPKIRRSEN